MDETLFTPAPLPEGWMVAVRHANGFWLAAATTSGNNGYRWTKRLRDIEKFDSEKSAKEAIASTDADPRDIAMIRISPTAR